MQRESRKSSRRKKEVVAQKMSYCLERVLVTWRSCRQERKLLPRRVHFTRRRLVARNRNKTKKVDNLAAIHPYYICSIKTTDLRCLSSSQQLQERYRELRSRHASCRGARMKRREKPTPQVFPVALHSGNQ